jgi:hypothetical protein
MSNNGLCWSRYRPRKPHHGNRIPLFSPWPRDPKTSLRRDYESLPRWRCLGTMPRGRESSLRHSVCSRGLEILHRHPYLLAKNQYQRHQIRRRYYPRWNNILHGKSNLSSIHSSNLLTPPTERLGRRFRFNTLQRPQILRRRTLPREPRRLRNTALRLRSRIPHVCRLSSR